MRDESLKDCLNNSDINNDEPVLHPSMQDANPYQSSGQAAEKAHLEAPPPRRSEWLGSRHVQVRFTPEELRAEPLQNRRQHAFQHPDLQNSTSSESSHSLEARIWHDEASRLMEEMILQGPANTPVEASHHHLRHYIGQMDQQCSFRSALHWAGESLRTSGRDCRSIILLLLCKR